MNKTPSFRHFTSGWFRLSVVLVVVGTLILLGLRQQRGGDEIVFVYERDGLSDIFAINADGSGETRLTNQDYRFYNFIWTNAYGVVPRRMHPWMPNPESTASSVAPNWSPNGTHLAFVSDRSGSREIFVMEANGRSPTQLTSLGMDSWPPLWSPDGSQIAFLSLADRDDTIDLYVVRPDGKNLRQLSSNSEHPSWSPDSRQIVFQAWLQDSYEIMVTAVDGSGYTRLTRNKVDDTVPAWSPDGRLIAFASWREAGSDLYLVEPDGGNLRQLTHLNRPINSWPAWSPDGRLIAFITVNAQTGLNELHTIQPDGTALTPIFASEETINYPIWSPNGDQILFTLNKNGRHALHIVDKNGRQSRQLSEQDLGNWAPSWRPTAKSDVRWWTSLFPHHSN